jgi:outer membrane protein assembly factor BamB
MQLTDWHCNEAPDFFYERGHLMRTNLFVADLTSRLYTVDPATGSIGLVGPCGMANVTDIAFHGPTLYGVSFSQFLRLNPDTGTAAVIGTIGFSTNGLAVSEEGTIYAGTTNGQLITINPITGAGTVVGAFGGGMISGGDLAFDANGVLYGALVSGPNFVLARIDRNTGVATTIGPTGIANVYGLAFHCCRLFGGTASGELLSVNAATGAALIIGKNNITMGGMAARCSCCS